MGQTPEQIEVEIDRTREALRANFEELETRAKEVTDWRSQFRRHPEGMAVAALVGGALLSLLLGKR